MGGQQAMRRWTNIQPSLAWRETEGRTCDGGFDIDFKLIHQGLQRHAGRELVDDQPHRSLIPVRTQEYHRVVKPGIPDSRHSDQQLTCQFHVTASVAARGPSTQHDAQARHLQPYHHLWEIHFLCHD